MGESTGLWLCDAEDGGSTPWQWTTIYNAGSATFSENSTAKNNGTYGWLFTADGSSLAYSRKTYAARDEIYVRFYINIPSGVKIGTGAGEGLVLAEFNAVLSDEVRFGIQTGSGGTPNQWFTRINSTQYYSSTSFSVGTWHYIELRYLKGASNNGGMEIWIDGTKDAALSNVTVTMNVQTSAFYLGAQYMTSAISAGGAIYFDDCKADSAYIGAYSSGGTAQALQNNANYYYRRRSS
jgi:hypothetical protein